MTVGIAVVAETMFAKKVSSHHLFKQVQQSGQHSEGRIAQEKEIVIAILTVRAT